VTVASERVLIAFASVLMLPADLVPTKRK
jgi:hypothetical protein